MPYCLDALDCLYNSDANTIISGSTLQFSPLAPTASGKTVCAEIAIARLRECRQDGDSSKVIYLAPIKTLCRERMQDWTAKFTPLGKHDHNFKLFRTYLFRGDW